MRQIAVILSAFYSITAQAVSWSSPSCLFTSESEDGIQPKIEIHPTEPLGYASWIGRDIHATIYTSRFHDGIWESAQIQSDLCHIQEAIDQGFKTLDTYAWERYLFPENIFEEDVIIPTHAAIRPDGTFLLAWQSIDKKLYLANLEEGRSVNPSIFFENIKNACFSGTGAIVATSGAIYNKDLVTETEGLLFPRPSFDSSLGMDSCDKGKAFFFQDQKSLFLLSGIYLEEKYSYGMIGTLKSFISCLNVAINTNTGFPTAIWQLKSGEIQTATFNGVRWGKITTLCPNGSSPSIAYHPITNQMIGVWSNRITNTIEASETKGLNWGDPVSISAIGDFLADTGIKINAQGDSLIIWSRKEKANSRKIIEAVTNVP